MKLSPLLLLAPLTWLLASCGHVFTKNHTYEDQSTSGAEVNGATVFAHFEPQGGSGGLSASAMVYFAGSASLEGPFKWSIKARGETGEHEILRINAIKTATEKTGRSEWFPKAYLGENAVFKPIRKNKALSLAKVTFPGLLEVYPEKDGAIDLLVDVTIVAKSGTQRKRVKFHLEPVQTRETEFIFVPGSIIKSFNAEDYADED